MSAADARHGGVDGTSELAPHPADLLAVCLVVRDVGQVEGHADEVSRLAAYLAQRSQQVAECLAELLDDATGHDPHLSVERRLPAEVERVPRQGSVGVPAGRGESTGIDGYGRHANSALHPARHGPPSA
jgi:uncharacterized protein with LGFP repeats